MGELMGRFVTYISLGIKATRHVLALCCLSAALSAVLLTGCRKEDEPKVDDPTTARTVLVYMVAENSLSSFATYDGKTNSGDITEMLHGLSALSDNDRLVVYLDDCHEGVGSSIYVLTNKEAGKSFDSLKPTYKLDGDRDSAKPETLREVLSYVVKKCKADEYGLVFWSHGSGWVPSSEDCLFAPRRTFGIDNQNNNMTSDSGSQMEIADMKTVLAEFPKTKFIFFDACYMQCVEVAYALRDVTDYIIASPAEIPGNGAPYKAVLNPMFADKLDLNDIINEYYNHYNTGATRYGVLLSKVKCSELDNLAKATAEVVGKHKQKLLEMDYSDVLDYNLYDKNKTLGVYPDYYDILGIMQCVNMHPDELEAWEEALHKAVPYSMATDTWATASSALPRYLDRYQFSGVSMFVPLQKYKEETAWNNYFQRLYDCYFDTEWCKAVWK